MSPVSPKFHSGSEIFSQSQFLPDPIQHTPFSQGSQHSSHQEGIQHDQHLQRAGEEGRSTEDHRPHRLHAQMMGGTQKAKELQLEQPLPSLIQSAQGQKCIGRGIFFLDFGIFFHP